MLRADRQEELSTVKRVIVPVSPVVDNPIAIARLVDWIDDRCNGW